LVKTATTETTKNAILAVASISRLLANSDPKPKEMCLMYRLREDVRLSRRQWR
jgi:hypothetical protein